jgi:DUF4097 and DUF4098 domain-containing protein YvlB
MYEFSTSEPVRLRLELGAGDIEIDAVETDTSTVRLDAYRDDDASRDVLERTIVEQRGNEIRVESPRKSSFFRRGIKLRARITVPVGSSVEAKTDSADLSASGSLANAIVKTGSGDIRLDHVDEETSVATGSGDVDLASGGATTRVESGSGDLSIRHARGRVNVSTGSGDIRVGAADDTVQANSGSGDIKVGEAHGDVALNTASGDQQITRAERGRVRCNAASGDITIGIADGTAAWLEVNSISGSVQSQLDGAEPPGEDEETVQVKANTVSGDIVLVHA